MLLKVGSRGSDVRKLQQDLTSLGYNVNGIDGIFGNGLKSAVIKFQRANGLSADGIVGKDTRAAIDKALKNGGSTTPTSSTLLKVGSRGSDVRKLQQDLTSLGYDVNGIDGIFGNGLKSAVIKFQRANGLSADGIVGKDTRAAIDKALKNGGSTTPTSSTLLKVGSRGSDVRKLQQDLTSLGYNVNGIDGIFGNGLKSAVIKFQRANGLSADGIVGKDTRAAIDKALKNGGSTTPTSSTLLKVGSRGDEVKKLQQDLTSLGYDVNGIDGIFGNGLKSAVIKFQSAHGLSADGIVGKDTRAAIDTALRNREIIEPPIGGYNIYNPNQSNYTVNVNLISKNYRSRKHGNSIKAIVIHWIGNPKSTAIANRNYFANTDRSASAHYIVGLNGEVVQAVKEENCAFHAGGSSYTNLANTRFKSGSSRMHNDWTIGVESCHEDANGNYNSKTYTTLVRLAANLLDKYNLNTQTDLLRHYDFTHKDCPKLFCGENNQNWAKFKSDVDKVRTNSINIPVTNAQMPSNVKFSSNERTITITFNKGKDSVKTILGDSQKNKLQETTGNSFVIEMPVYGQKYIVYLKSIASDGTETAWSGGYAVTTGTPSESIYLQRKLSYDPRVEILQTDLKTLGYDIGKYGADGKYGDSTEKAIKSFQKNNWIYVDGITRLSTIKTISKVLRQNNLEFYNYCKHPKVKVLQEKLHKLGLYNIKIDDKYGESTQKAVKSFQEKYLKNYLSYYKETEKLGVADPFTINHINKEYSKHVNNSGNTNNPHSNKYNEAIYKHIDESFIMQFVNTFLDVKDYWQKDFFLDTKFEKTYKINKCLSLTLSAGINKDNSSTANHINAGSLNIKNFQVDNLSLPNVTCSGEDLDNLLEKLKNLRIISDNFLKDVDLTGISFVAARPNLDDEKFSFTLFEMQYAAELEDVLQHYGIDSLPIDFNGRTLFVRATFDINIDLDDVKKGLITAEIALVAILGLIIIIEAGGVTMTLGAIYSALMPLSPIIYKFEELLQQWTPALNGF